MSHKTRIMYIEYKGDDVSGPARIGRVTFSKTGMTLYYKGKRFARLKGSGFKANYTDEETGEPYDKDKRRLRLRGRGFKANYFDEETGEQYWISGCKKDGTDALYSNTVEIDEDVREEYWTEIRGRSDLKGVASLNSPGKHSK